MMKYLFFVLFFSSFFLLSQSCQEEWAQCGGISFLGTTECCSPLTCEYQGEYYSQCRFIETSSNNCQHRYQQCGGQIFNGNINCCQGLTCVYQDSWWSSCQLIINRNDTINTTNDNLSNDTNTNGNKSNDTITSNNSNDSNNIGNQINETNNNDNKSNETKSGNMSNITNDSNINDGINISSQINETNNNSSKNLTLIQSKGNIPTNLPNQLLIGLFLDDPNPTWMKDSQVPWDVQYRYLTKNWVNNWGYGNYDGTFAYNFFTKANNDGFIPAVQYYQMNSEAPWQYDESKFVAKLGTNSTMVGYFKDFIIFMKQAKKFGKPVLVLMEADGFGFCQRQSNGNSSLYAAISDTGIAELQGLPNTIYGFGLALLKIKKEVGASNVYMGIHISGWATNKDLFFGSQAIPLQPEIDQVYNFLLPFGLNKQNIVGEEFDFLVADPLDRDADFYRLTKNQNRWWDISDSAAVNTSSFNRHIEYLNLFNKKAEKKWIVWQIPLGNSNHNNVPNSNKLVASEGYKDNRPEYFFADNQLGLYHCKKYAEAGVYALLFGRGESQQSNYVNDVYFDGQLFMKTRVKKNYYDLGGVNLNRTGN